MLDIKSFVICLAGCVSCRAVHAVLRFTDLVGCLAVGAVVGLAREFGQSARTLIGIAARSCPRSTLLTTPSCVNRDNVVSFARLGAGRPRANTVDAGVPSDD